MRRPIDLIGYPIVVQADRVVYHPDIPLPPDQKGHLLVEYLQHLQGVEVSELELDALDRAVMGRDARQDRRPRVEALRDPTRRVLRLRLHRRAIEDDDLAV